MREFWKSYTTLRFKISKQSTFWQRREKMARNLPELASKSSKLYWFEDVFFGVFVNQNIQHICRHCTIWHEISIRTFQPTNIGCVHRMISSKLEYLHMYRQCKFCKECHLTTKWDKDKTVTKLGICGAGVMRLGHSIFMGTPRGPPSSHPSCHTWEGKKESL